MGGHERAQGRHRQPSGADRIPAARDDRRRHGCEARAPELHAAPQHGRSIARIWNDAAVDVLRLGDASEPVQARDLFDLATTVSRAWHATSGEQARETAISYAAYRLLVWRASYGSNLDRAFTLLSGQLRALCLSPDFTRTSGSSAAAVGNRIGAAAIAAGRNDGSNEALHYADPTYTPLNEPLVVAPPARQCMTRPSGNRWPSR